MAKMAAIAINTIFATSVLTQILAGLRTGVWMASGTGTDHHGHAKSSIIYIYKIGVTHQHVW
jgi:hypothetical protein